MGTAVDVSQVRYNRRTGEYSALVTLTNVSTEDYVPPLYAVIQNITSPTVSVVNADGEKPNGDSFFDVTSLVTEGALSPGEPLSFDVVFDNSLRERFEFEVLLLDGLVPDVVGLTQAVAQSTLADMGYFVGATTDDSHDTVPTGNIISQDPVPGTAQPPGTAIDLVISVGPGIKADFVVFPSSGPTPLEVTFQYANPVKAHEITSWSWDFDNDGVVDSTESSPSYTYDLAGTYTASLTVKNGLGETAQSILVDAVYVRERVEVIVRNNVILIDNDPELTFVSKTETELVLEYTGASADPILLDDIAIGTDEDGYARLVSSVSESGLNLVLSTENVALTEIFQQADVSGVVDFSVADFAKAGIPVNKAGQAFVSLNGITLGGAIRLDGSLEFDPAVDFDLLITNGQAEYFKCEFLGSLDRRPV